MTDTVTTMRTSSGSRETRLDAGGTAWRLRSLVAMGHDCSRIARALQTNPETVQRVVSGRTLTVAPQFRARTCHLWDAWWDKTPPQRNPAERRAAAIALRQAERNNWPAAAGLDEDLLDEPGYRPWSHYRPAIGTGHAGDFGPVPGADGESRVGSPREQAAAAPFPRKKQSA